MCVARFRRFYRLAKTARDFVDLAQRHDQRRQEPRDRSRSAPEFDDQAAAQALLL